MALDGKPDKQRQWWLVDDLRGPAVFTDDTDALGLPHPIRARTHSYWPDEQCGPWVVTITWIVDGDDVIPAGLDIRSFQIDLLNGENTYEPGPAGVTRLVSTDLGKLPIARLVRLHQRHVVVASLILANQNATDPEATTRHLHTASRAGTSKTHRRDHGPEHWQRIADLYTAAAAMQAHPIPGDLRPGYKPVKWMTWQMKESGEDFVTESTVHDWVRRARQYGYLPPTGRKSRKDPHT